jgi:hypothetical protein
MSVGLEAAADLIADLAQGLGALAGLESPGTDGAVRVAPAGNGATGAADAIPPRLPDAAAVDRPRGGDR